MQHLIAFSICVAVMAFWYLYVYFKLVYKFRYRYRRYFGHRIVIVLVLKKPYRASSIMNIKLFLLDAWCPLANDNVFSLCQK